MPRSCPRRLHKPRVLQEGSSGSTTHQRVLGGGWQRNFFSFQVVTPPLSLPWPSVSSSQKKRHKAICCCALRRALG